MTQKEVEYLLALASLILAGIGIYIYWLKKIKKGQQSDFNISEASRKIAANEKKIHDLEEKAIKFQFEIHNIKTKYENSVQGLEKDLEKLEDSYEKIFDILIKRRN